MTSNIETLRKLLITGLGTAFMTEDSLLKYLSDLKLPRDAKNYLLGQAQKGKDELARVLSQELRRYLGKLNLQEILKNALDGMNVDIQAQVHFRKGRPSLKVTGAQTSRRAKGKRTTRRATQD